jgi:hypothetical protein
MNTLVINPRVIPIRNNPTKNAKTSENHKTIVQIRSQIDSKNIFIVAPMMVV